MLNHEVCLYVFHYVIDVEILFLIGSILYETFNICFRNQTPRRASFFFFFIIQRAQYSIVSSWNTEGIQSILGTITRMQSTSFGELFVIFSKYFSNVLFRFICTRRQWILHSSIFNVTILERPFLKLKRRVFIVITIISFNIFINYMFSFFFFFQIKPD